MEIDQSTRRLNPFAFPAETSARFTLLMITALTLVWTVGSFFINTVFGEVFNLSSDVEEIAATLQEAAQVIDSQNLNGAAIERSLTQLKAVLATNLFLLSLLLGLTLLSLVVAAVIYLAHPKLIRRRKQLQPASSNKDGVMEAVSKLANRVDISPPPTVEITKTSHSTDGQAFGVRNRYVLAFGNGIRMQRIKEPDKFCATILHELAHIVNRDVGYYYFSEAIWYAVILLALIPWLAYLYLDIIRNFFQGLLTAGLAGVNWVFLLTDALPTLLFFTVQLSLTLLIIWFIRRSLLRIREVYADWRAALWGVEQPLLSMLQKRASKEQVEDGVWKKLWRFHPKAQERLDMLQEPSKLFRIGPDLPFLTGFLLGYSLSGLLRLIILLWAPVRLGGEVLLLNLVQLSTSWPTSLSNSIMALAQLAMRHLIPDIVLLGLLLVVANLVVRAVGLQIQRESVVELVTGQRELSRPLRLWFHAILMAIGLEVGILLAPINLFAPNGLIPALLTPLWLMAVIFLSWLWFIYSRFFARRLLGSHVGVSAPDWTRRLLTLVMGGLLWALYLPALIGQLAITMTDASINLLGVNEATATQILWLFLISMFITLGTSLFLYILAFGVTWGVVQARRIFAQSRCPSCQQNNDHQFAVGQRCVHCGHNLAPWLFVELPSTVATLQDRKLDLCY